MIFQRSNGRRSLRRPVGLLNTSRFQVRLHPTYTQSKTKNIPVQKPGPDEVLVNIKYSGVCHTDLHAVNGDWPIPTKLPLVGGHEGAGVIVAKGELVQDVQVGDHAGIKVKPGRRMISHGS